MNHNHYQQSHSSRAASIAAAKKKKRNRTIVLVSASSVLIFGILYFFVSFLPFSQDGRTASVSLAVSDENDWTYGDKESGIVLVEYSDFQCPACGVYYPMLKQLKQDLGESFLFVYRHFPLPSHRNAKIASYAAEAAGIQGKFWEMHDLIFERQREWTNYADARLLFIAYAEELGLDTDAFERDIDSDAVRSSVDNDLSSGRASWVNGTPTFFLNGSKIQNPRSPEEFKRVILGSSGE